MALSEKARQLRNENQRIWGKNNPDKIRKYQSDYWERKAAGYSDSQRAKDLKAKGLTQREIAKILNVSLGTVNGYLNKD